ncbi:hypothetical protein [Streptomyces crystallinus]|uniref:Uncharacterized protein n=1 Tax=Streptomyces crystallinus TaxID=68191 RepID=A0ABN1GRH9_9ACTN
MQMHTDDEVYAVDNVFLGPPGTRLPWRARYQAYGVGAFLTALLLGLEIQLGVLGIWPIAYGMLAVIFLTRQICRHITYEHGVLALLRTLWNEVRAPRQRSAPAVTADMSLPDIRRREQY